jgi:hypothetical protein
MKFRNHIPFGLIAFYASAMFLIYGPLRQLTESGPIIIFEFDVLASNTIIPFLGGTLCGFLISKKSKYLGALIGGVSSGAGGALYTCYYLSGGSTFILGSIGVVIALTITVGPGAYIYHVITRAKEIR